MRLRASDVKIANTFFKRKTNTKLPIRRKTTQMVVHPGTQKDTAN